MRKFFQAGFKNISVKKLKPENLQQQVQVFTLATTKDNLQLVKQKFEEKLYLTKVYSDKSLFFLNPNKTFQQALSSIDKFSKLNEVITIEKMVDKSGKIPDTYKIYAKEAGQNNVSTLLHDLGNKFREQGFNARLFNTKGNRALLIVVDVDTDKLDENLTEIDNKMSL